MPEEALIVRGAREHNLKNIDVTIPRDRLTVITGLSGSGKSSLAFDTIYAEGQRRYVESLSAYARQFLGLMEKPDVDAIEGLSPAISIEQKTAGHNPRSTVGTVTEIYDYLRLLFARAGTPHCPTAGAPCSARAPGRSPTPCSPGPRARGSRCSRRSCRGRKGEFRELFETTRKQGFIRAVVDGELIELADPPKLNKRQNHNVSVVVDRLVVRAEDRARPRRLARDGAQARRRVGGGDRARRRRRPARDARLLRAATAAPRAASPSPSSSRDTSRSTPPSAPAPPAADSGRGRR
jgi:excinuclease ABC subunit A